MLVRRIQTREPPVQNIRQLEAALHQEWQQLSQQNNRRLTGGMRRRVEAVIQARGGYTRYWTLNNRCRQVIHKWRFESEMTILLCVWRSILKMDMFYCNNWPCDIVIKYSLIFHFRWRHFQWRHNPHKSSNTSPIQHDILLFTFCNQCEFYVTNWNVTCKAHETKISLKSCNESFVSITV